MKNKDNIEDLLRRRFENEEFPVSERVWENIKKTLPPEKSNWRPYLFSFFGIISCVGLITVLFFIRPDEKAGKLTKESGMINSQAHKEAVTEEIKEDQVKDLTKEEINNSEISKDRKFNIIHQSTKNENTGLTKPLQLLQKEVNLNIKYDVNWSNGKRVENMPIGKSQEKVADPKRLIADLAEIRVIQSNNSYYTEDDINDYSIEKLTSLSKAKILENSTLINSNGHDKNELILNNNYNDSLSLRSVKINHFSKKVNEMVDSLEARKSEESQSNNKKKKGNKIFLSNPISIDIFANPLISYRTIVASSNLKSDLNANEKPKINIGAGIKVNFDLNEKWRLGVGINYSSYGERYKLGKDFYKEKTAYFGYYQQDSSGAFIVKTDSSKYIEKYNAKYKNNYYKYIGIPFYVTRVLSNGKFGVAVTAGASINFLVRAYTSRVSSLTDTAIAVIEESSQNAHSPFRKTAVSAFLTSTLSYEIGSRSKVFLEPGITYFINSTYKSDYPVKRNIYGFQLMAGIRYILKD